MGYEFIFIANINGNLINIYAMTQLLSGAHHENFEKFIALSWETFLLVLCTTLLTTFTC